MEDLSASRRLSPAPFGEAFLEQLPDSLIQEILLRLPLSSVFRSRCVSKLCRSLTTSPYFIRRRELHCAHFRQDPPLGLLLQNSYHTTIRKFLLCSGVLEVKLPDFSFNFLPGFRLSGITVMGSCEDLLLCCNRDLFHGNSFVVNPITGQWIALPPTPWEHMHVLAGFVCEPISVPRARKGGELRYRVVQIPVFEGSKTEFNVEIFSSEDGQWNEYAMTLAEGLRTQCCSQRGIACNGILYWQFNFGGVKVIGLDPFNPKEKKIYLIQNTTIQNMHDILHIDSKKYVLGMCQGKLKMMLLSWSEVMHEEVSHLKIWELENGRAKWRLVKVVPLLEILAANLSIVHPWDAVHSSLMTLAFHPNNEDIIYLECYWTNKVICCNLKRMSLKIVSDYYLDESLHRCANVFQFVFPWWPTPIPALPKR